MKKTIKTEIVERPEPVEIPYEELKLMAELYESKYFVIMKRIGRRMADELRKQAFALSAEEPGFTIKHTRYKERAQGVVEFFELIKQASVEFQKLVND